MNGLFTKDMRSEYDDDQPTEQQQLPVPAKPKFQDELTAFVNKLNYKRAWLPADYDKLKADIEKIQSIDLLKELSDKSKAMESYERARRENEQAIGNLRVVVKQLWTRMGKLYREKLSKGGEHTHRKHSSHEDRVGAAAEGAKHGHSPKQVTKAIKLATEESPPPEPTPAKAKPVYPPSDFRSPEHKEATKLLYALEQFGLNTRKLDREKAVAGMSEDEQVKCFAICEAMCKWLTDVMVRLG